MRSLKQFRAPAVLSSALVPCREAELRRAPNRYTPRAPVDPGSSCRSTRARGLRTLRGTYRRRWTRLEPGDSLSSRTALPGEQDPPSECCSSATPPASLLLSPC